MRASALLLVAAILGACLGPEGDPVIEIVYDPCQPVALVPAPDTAPAELEAITAGAALWNDTGATTLVTGGEIEGARPLPIVFEEGAPLFHGIYEDSVGVVVINRNLAGARARAITVAHELGHAFGLLHVTDRPSLMNPGNLDVEPTAEDLAALRALWGPCSPRVPGDALDGTTDASFTGDASAATPRPRSIAPHRAHPWR